MSEMQKVKVNFNDQAMIVESLKEMGFVPQVHEEAVQIRTYYASQERKANIVIPKEQFNGMADAGFERTSDGSYVFHVDDYDWGKNNRLAKIDLKKIKHNYTKVKIKKHVSQTTDYTLIGEEIEEDGSTKLRLRIEEF